MLDVQIAGQIWADILKRPYITIGMSAFLMHDSSRGDVEHLALRRLGKAWRQLHKLTYVVVVLGALHFVLLRKGLQIEPMLYLLAVLGLLGLRRAPTRRGQALQTG